MIFQAPIRQEPSDSRQPYFYLQTGTFKYSPCMKKYSWVFILAGAFLLVAHPVSPVESIRSSPFVTIRILHTNDIHGHILPEPDLKAGHTPPPLFGGAASLATAIKRYRKEPAFGHPPDQVLYFDAGDFFQGTPEGTLTRGAAMIEIFKRLKLDAMGAGNHDFDFGIDGFRQLADSASWPIISLNVLADTGSCGLSRDVFITNKDLNLRIAVLGWITDDMASVTTAQTRRGLNFLGSLETALREVAVIRDTADLVIAITHVGVNQDMIIANTVPGIHVIVGGHSHTSLSPYYRSDSTGTIVVQAGSNLGELGVLDILFNKKTKKIVRANSRLLPLYESEFPPDPAMTRWIKQLSAKVGRLLNEQVAVSAEDYLKASDTECVPGNLLTDAMRWATGADVAFQNSFGIRADLPKGPITLRTLFTIMPFDNTTVSMTLRGNEILDLLEQSATRRRGFLQMSGARMTVDLHRLPGERVLSAEIGNDRIDLQKNYRVATNSFLAEGGDLFDTFSRGVDRKDDGRNMRETVKDFLRHQTAATNGVFRGRLENRIVIRGQTRPAPALSH